MIKCKILTNEKTSHAIHSKDLKYIKSLVNKYQEFCDSKEQKRNFFRLLKAGAKLNDANMIWRLADAYEYGLGVRKSLAKAEEYYWRAADLGVVEAITDIAFLYWERGDDESKKKAIALYKKASEEGEKHAIHNLGICYSTGNGLRRNRPLAFKYFTRSAMLGHVESAFKVGWCYLHGEGVLKDKCMAKKWLSCAARSGHEDAIKILQEV